MRTPFDDPALIQDNDLITVSDRGEPMRNHDAGYTAVLDRLDQFVLGFGIQRRLFYPEYRFIFLQSRRAKSLIFF